MQTVQFNPEEFNYLRDLAIKETETLEKNIKNQFNVAAHQEVLELNRTVKDKLTKLLRSGAYSVTFGGDIIDDEDEEIEIIEEEIHPIQEAPKKDKKLDWNAPITLEEDEEDK